MKTYVETQGSSNQHGGSIWMCLTVYTWSRGEQQIHPGSQMVI